MYYLIPDNYLYFPHPENTAKDGILGLGGDLSVSRLILAYKFGIFPWYNEGDPIIWWSPNPRLVLEPKNLKIAKSMRPYFNQRKFQISYDADFPAVIKACATNQREGQAGTWITKDMEQAYIDMHDAGYAHSVEVWKDDVLVGGLYGISLGKIFYGESMFAKVSNASKFGFISLVQELRSANYQLIDCQQETQHLKSLGASSITRSGFLNILRQHAYDDPNHLFWKDLQAKSRF